ncbi:MAG: FmdB family zinc ribbon protein [Actinomycetota bacterium]
MPTYEYVCLSCDRHFEVYQSFSDEPLRTCEVCGGPLRRVFHPVGIVLKGSGFYSTDNRSSKRRTEPKKETSDTSPSETKTETKSETKSETKPSSGSSDKSSGDKGSSKKGAK